MKKDINIIDLKTSEEVIEQVVHKKFDESIYSLEGPNSKLLAVRIPEEFYKRLSLKAAIADKSLPEFIRELLYFQFFPQKFKESIKRGEYPQSSIEYLYFMEVKLLDLRAEIDDVKSMESEVISLLEEIDSVKNKVSKFISG